MWEKVVRTLAQDSDNEYQMIDFTMVRPHQHSSGAKQSERKKSVLEAVQED